MATKFRFNYNNQTVDFEDYYVRADFFRQGNLWAWGNNFNGKLGDNTTASKSSPIQEITRGTNWSFVASGRSHTAAIKTDGTLWTWGNNGNGKLGDNTTANKSSPIQTITGGNNWSSVAVGYGHTAAIKTDGTLWTWGLNTNGQLGNNTTTHRSSPIQTIAVGTNWSKIACGRGHTAGVKTDGTLWTWGRNYSGQLGDNTTTNRSSPVQTITGGTNWSKIACGYLHTAAIKTDGTIWTWGRNYSGELGDGTATNKSSPVQTITGGTTWNFVACGTYYTAAIKTDGTIWLWGGNGIGQLGDNTTASKSSPIQTIAGGTNWSKVACGGNHTAAIKTDGTLWLWGDNTFYGQLGDNTSENKSSPVQEITRGTNWKQVNAGYDFTAAVTYLDDIYVPTSSTAPSGTVAPTATPTPSVTPPAATPTPSATPSATGAPGPTQQFEP
jgi:alpha-tubulin suppressor-like RCC1 family protein